MLPNALIVGNLVKDPVGGMTRKQDEYARFSVACDGYVSKKDPHPKTHFYDCVAWGVSAGFINKHVKKGDGVAIVAEITTNTYTNNADQRIKCWNFNVKQITITNKRDQTKNSTPQKAVANADDNEADDADYEASLAELNALKGPFADLVAPVDVDVEAIVANTQLNFVKNALENEDEIDLETVYDQAEKTSNNKEIADEDQSWKRHLKQI